MILCSGSEKSMRHFPHNSRNCGKCFREIEEFLSYRVLVAVFQCDRIFGRDNNRLLDLSLCSLFSRNRLTWLQPLHSIRDRNYFVAVDH